MFQPRFSARSAFHATVKRRVEQYFADRRLATTGDWRLFVKTGVILAWIAGSYALLVFGVTSWPKLRFNNSGPEMLSLLLSQSSDLSAGSPAIRIPVGTPALFAPLVSKLSRGKWFQFRNGPG